MKILVVDDDDVAQFIARKILQAEGHEVFLACDGKEALQLLREHNIPIVISDWNMPNMDGLELCRLIKSQPALNTTYVIMVTSRKGEEDMVKGLEAGANDFITKPFQPILLSLRIRNAEKLLALETTEAFLEIISNLAEAKDTEFTGTHLIRMREYCKLLAQRLMQKPEIQRQVHPRFPDLMYKYSPLHDIGKIGIRDAILLKPGQLNDQEWAEMKKHTLIAADPIAEVLKKYPYTDHLHIAYEVTLYHHERWDGTGYPMGLKGEQIPLSARIVTLADVYDAITNQRPYHTAVPHKVARDIILEQSGRHFDPAVVAVFLEAETEFMRILSDHSSAVIPQIPPAR